MRIDLSVCGLDGVERDVAICASGPVPLDEVCAALRNAFGPAYAADGWWSGNRPLPREALLGGPGLRNGARLSYVGRTAESTERQVDVVNGMDAGRFLPGSLRTATVGRDPSCDLAVHDPDVSRQHAEIGFSASGVTIRDLGSTHGTTLDGTTVTNTARSWPNGALVRLGDTHLAIAAVSGAPAPRHSRADGSIVVQPGLRAVPKRAPTFELLTSPAKRTGAVPWISVAIPAAAGVGLAVLLGSPQFLAFALLSPVALLGTSVADRVAARRRDRPDQQVELARIQAGIAAALAAERRARAATDPDAATIMRIAQRPLARIWERARDDPELLRVRLGLGSAPSLVSAGTSARAGPAGVLESVPVVANLADGALGLVGPREIVRGIARWLVVQLAVLAAPDAVQFALLTDVPDAWHWLRWLPHDVSVAAGVAHTAGRALVIVCDGATASELATARAASSDDTTAICLAESPEDLQVSCAEVLTVANDVGSRLHRGSETVLAERVGADWAERVSRALAPLTVARSVSSATLPPTCRLSDVFGGIDADSIRLRWAGRTGRIGLPLGIGLDGPIMIDLDRDGPHLLVGGTTGSGKSQLLRTLVAGLAASHPPEDVAFVLIDYKGGAAFADCAGLPHVTGVVTDLDAHLTKRALDALRAELRRREQLLAGAGATDLAGYRAAGATPSLPRLVLIVDEFATLSKELPDFVPDLTSIAQRGRSLGLHLVLATQRPAGVVTAEIRANCSLRIALRVTDAADSLDVIDAPDAAAIPHDRPGRAYVWSGDAITPVQVASGDGTVVRGRPAVTVHPLAHWRTNTMAAPDEGTATSELQELVAGVRAANALHGFTPVAPPWLPPLPERISVSELARPAAPPRIAIGLVDEPADQRQRPLVLDLAHGGSVLFAGGSRSGRTSALLTVALAAASRLPPAELQLHAVDLAGELLEPLAMLPQHGTLVGPDGGVQLADALLQFLETQPAGGLTLLLVDAWERLVRASQEWDGGRTVERLLSLLRSGAHSRQVVIAGDRSALSPTVSASITTRVLLALTDRADYGLAGIAASAVPTSMRPGRAVLAPTGLEVQIADDGAGPTPADRLEAARASAARWTAAPAGHALRLQPLPSSVRLGELPEPSTTLSFAVAAPRGDPVALPLSLGPARLLVAGPPRSGRSTVLSVLLHQAVRVGARVTVAGPSRSPVRLAAGRLGVPTIEPGGEATGLSEHGDVVLIDDSESFTDRSGDEVLERWARDLDGPSLLVVTARTDDLTRTFRGVAAQVRRGRCGLLLQPGQVDGDLLGIRLQRGDLGGPPGRGVLLGDPGWAPEFAAGPLRVQVAHP